MREKFDVRAIHEFLNRLWEDVFTLNQKLKEELPKFGFKVEDVEEVFGGAYIFLDGEWRQMSYPHPAFEVKPQIEVGATPPESYYFVVAVPKEKVSEDFLEAFLEAFPKSFIYGSEDFLNDVYNCMRDSPPCRRRSSREYKKVLKRFSSSRPTLTMLKSLKRDFLRL